MDSTADDFDAARQIAAILEPISDGDRDRVVRWALEKLGQPIAATIPPPLSPEPGQHERATETERPANIETFVDSKKPSSDVQFAAVVAYYHALEAPEAAKKPEISGEDLLEASRLAKRRRPPKPGQTLRNAMQMGYLDKGSDRGTFKLNSVGENLVAMVLPGTSDGSSTGTRRTRKARKQAARKSPAKKAASQARKRSGKKAAPKSRKRARG